MSNSAAGSPDISFQTTLDVRDNCLCLNAQRAARALARRFDEAFQPFGITSGQFSLLMALNRPAPPTIGEAASTLAMDRTTLTAALKPLVARGLCTIGVDADDRRGRRLMLTPAGKQALAVALPTWHAVHRDIGADGLMSGLPELLRELTVRA